MQYFVEKGEECQVKNEIDPAGIWKDLLTLDYLLTVIGDQI